ncbi:MAG: hypothetical protein NTU83_11445 [Candidatus Hydrogenedentes bacterium]|nr:hypothetical protein [Candidatus Hydrogenedentota bacterium]
MAMNRLHLICNAHLDPVWLWEWEEGAAEALSTFRTAADLCEEFEEFVFNHNEVTLYKYVEEYEPALFARIQKLVAAGRWHVMGGWYLQPDCNMPCGESFVRQILIGKAYFKEKFGVEPTTAINFDIPERLRVAVGRFHVGWFRWVRGDRPSRVDVLQSAARPGARKSRTLDQGESQEV